MSAFVDAGVLPVLQASGERRFGKYYMVAPGSDYGKVMWSDLESMPCVEFYDYVLPEEGPLISLLHHIHFSFALNRDVELPFKNLWSKRYALQEKALLDASESICVIFTDVSACRVDCSYLAALSGMSHVEMVIVLVNVVEAKRTLLERRLKFFDLVFSFDRGDCERYGFTYYPTIYSMPEIENYTPPRESDAFFIGSNKGGRLRKLQRLGERMLDAECLPEFYLTGVSRNDVASAVLVNCNNPLPYASVIDRTLRTNCIVELMGSGQSGVTLRTMEAICLNKRLLTDNDAVKSLPYYETGFIQHFNDVDDINIDFIRSTDQVDYRYTGDFSPIHLIERIDSCVEEERKNERSNS